MKLKGILLLFLLIAVAAGVVIAIVCLRPKTCERVEVRLEYTGADTLLTPQEVLSILNSHGIQLVGSAPGQLHRADVENALRTNVWFDSLLNLTPVGSTLMMDIRVKSPLIAVYPTNGMPYYIGHNGELLPDNSRVHSPLMVLNGKVATNYRADKTVATVKETALQEAYRIALAIEADSVFSTQLTQLYVNDASEVEAYSPLFRHSVLFGNADNIEQKLRQLHIVYDKALIYMPADTYSKVDVRFKNRVFATRKNITNIL